MAETAGGAPTSLDAILGGRLRLRQFVGGHPRGGAPGVGAGGVRRAAAAALPARRLVDVGAGVGAVGLSLLLRWPEALGDLVESEPGLAALARENAALNGIDARARVVVADVLSPRRRREAGLADSGADLVVPTPPFFEAGSVRASPDA